MRRNSGKKKGGKKLEVMALLWKSLMSLVPHQLIEVPYRVSYSQFYFFSGEIKIWYFFQLISKHTDKK